MGANKIIYFDNNATTPVDKRVFEAMRPFLTENYGNPSSIYDFGTIARKAVEKARAQVAQLLGAAPNEIIFTSCGTESDNAAIWSAVKTQTGKRRIVTTAVEHPAVLETCKDYKRRGYDVVFLPVNSDGQIDIDEVKRAINNETAIVSVMWANNETGVIFPVEEIAQIAKSKGALFHTDAVQAVGKIPVSLKNSAIRFLSMSGHKLNAPKGVGVLYVKNGTPFSPLIMGGHQEKGRRAGTENTPYIVGLGTACEIAADNINKENTFVRELRNKLEQGLLSSIKNTKVNGDIKNRLPNTCNISFKNVEGEAILIHLNDLGICASSGSACTSGSLEPSHVLKAMGIPFEFMHGSVRFSLSVYNTDDEVSFSLSSIPSIIDKLRAISPYK